MHQLFAYILWDQNPVILDFDYVTIRWYGLLFASGFLIGQWIIAYIFKLEEKPERDLEMLMIYMVLATIIGARLGHCFFYQPMYFLQHPIEILFIWEGGLASHGAAIGILTALYLYSRKRKKTGQTFLWVVDRIVIVVALGGAFIRFGNLMNSEIIGKPSDLPTSFVFAHSLDAHLENQPTYHVNEVEKRWAKDEDTLVGGITYTPLDIKVSFDKDYIEENQASQIIVSLNNRLLSPGSSEMSKHYRSFTSNVEVDTNSTRDNTEASFRLYGVPRHPAQLYESLSSFFIFLLLLWMYFRRKGETPQGLLFGTFLILIFSLRFFYEFLKENQVPFEDSLTLNMGQILSIPAVIFGIIVLYYALKKGKPKEVSAA